MSKGSDKASKKPIPREEIFQKDAIEGIVKEFNIYTDDQLISVENLMRMISELADERLISRITIALLNQHPEGSPNDIRERIFERYLDHIRRLNKISVRTTKSNISRATSLPKYFVFALYVAFVNELRKNNKPPGRDKLKNAVKHILNRSPYPREEWSKFLTKHFLEKHLPEFKEMTQESDYLSPEAVALGEEMPWLV